MDMTPKEKARKKYEDEGGQYPLTFDKGWDDRDAYLQQVIFGDFTPVDPIEMAMKAFAVGHQKGCEDSDYIIDRFEAFSKKVMMLADKQSVLFKEAQDLYVAIEAARVDTTGT